MEDMDETYQRVIVVADGPETVAALGRALDAVLTRAPRGTLAIGEFPQHIAATADPAPTAHIELERLQQAAALGGVASRWRHTLNNSLAALLAEAQLLGMGSLPKDDHDAVERIITLCRRMIAVVRDGPPTQ
jgi:signal transduction histidine kinase